MRSSRRRYVRRMPKIYGNLQPERRKLPSFSPIKWVRKLLPYGLIIGLVYIVFWSSAFKVKSVEVTGNTLTSSEELSKLVPRGGSMWSFPKSEVREELLKNPTIADVRVLRGLPNSILLEVTERESQAVWITNTHTSILDDRGRVFLQYTQDAVPNIDTEVGKALITLPRIVDTSGLQAEYGAQVASSLFLAFVSEVTENMTNLLPIWEIDRFEVGATTYDVTLHTRPGLAVQLNALGDAGVQVRNLARLDRDGKLTGATSVDLRVDRWAYVK